MQQIFLKAANTIQPIFANNFNVFKRKPIILLDKFTRWRKCADLINLSASGRMRLEWMIFYQSVGDKDAYKTAKHFGISAKTFYKWLKRFEESKEMVRALEDQSKRPHQVRKWEVSLIEETRIKSLRSEHLRWGRRKLKRLYSKIYGEDISDWKIQRVINKHHLYPNPAKQAKLTLKRQRSKAHPKRRIQELNKENLLWFLLQLDGIILYFNGFKRYIFTAVDHAGKFAFARMYKNKSSTSAADFLHRLKYAINQPILNLQTDNGSEFAGSFERAVRELEIERYFSRAKTPKDNPEIERFNQTLEQEWLYDGNFELDCDRFNRRLTKWIIEYNFVRPHETLNYLTPMEYIEINQIKQIPQQKTTNLLPMCPASTIPRTNRGFLI
jgi:transposase InsO family protein